MRIQSVENFKGANYTYSGRGNLPLPVTNPQLSVKTSGNADLFLVDKNYNGVMLKNKNISFNGVAKTALELAKKIPLEDRLASLFQVMKQGDLIIVSKNLQEAQQAIKTSLKSMKQIFKKAIYLEDDDIKGTFAFIKHESGETEIWNVNKENMILNRKDYLAPKESYYVLPDDVLKYQDYELKVKEKPKADLSMVRHTFSKVFNFEKDILPAIQKQNLKSISSIVKGPQMKSRPLTFSEIGGQDKAINELKKGIIFPIKYPEAYQNTTVNHGTILYGPPGTGKTLVAQALANEADADFIKLNGLELESKWVGESEERWRELFECAKQNQPSIIFIDEFDAVAKKRGGADVYGDKVVNQILTLMSDIEKDGDNVYVIAATNKLGMLDDAITRSGRFGKHIEMLAPDLKGTRKIIDIHSKNKPLSEDINLDAVAEKMYSKKATGADIASILTESQSNAYERAGIFEKMDAGTFEASDLDNLRITYEDLDKAIINVMKDTKSRNPVGYTHYKK